MSQSPPLSSRHGGLDRRNRRLSIIQDTAVDNLHHVDTHALDDTSPSPHHELSMMSYMDAHSPKDESSYRCSPPSPLKSRSNSVVAVEKVEKNVPRGNDADVIEAPPEPSAETPRNELRVEDARGIKGVVDLSKER